MAKDLAKDLKSAPSMGEEEEPVDEHEMISEDIIGAIKSGDAAMLTEALKAFVEACGKDPEAY
jgi:predicted lipid-binding transport protein (Tim44 family)